MKLAFRIIGIILIFLFSAYLGFFKAFSKREYIKRLKKTVLALSKAENMLRTGATSRDEILSASFSAVEKLRQVGGKTVVDDNQMREDIKSMINSFFCEFGSGDTISESQRIGGLKKELEEEICREEAEYAKVGKIWRTAGICAGLMAAIMLI